MLLAVALLFAQHQDLVSCNVMDLTLPPKYAAWKTPGEAFAPGKAVELKAAGGAVTIGFRIEKPGVYGIALDQRGWIDVIAGVAGGEPLKSVSHREGGSCWTIRKIVRFQLEPGLYRLALTRLVRPQARVMLVEGE
jgi:hypothetical protein